MRAVRIVGKQRTAGVGALGRDDPVVAAVVGERVGIGERGRWQRHGSGGRCRCRLLNTGDAVAAAYAASMPQRAPSTDRSRRRASAAPADRAPAAARPPAHRSAADSAPAHGRSGRCSSTSDRDAGCAPRLLRPGHGAVAEQLNSIGSNDSGLAFTCAIQAFTPATKRFSTRLASKPYASHRGTCRRGTDTALDVRSLSPSRAKVARDLPEAALSPQIHLPEPVARRGKALRNERVVSRGRIAVRYAPAVDQQFGRSLQPAIAKASVAMGSAGALACARAARLHSRRAKVRRRTQQRRRREAMQGHGGGAVGMCSLLGRLRKSCVAAAMQPPHQTIFFVAHFALNASALA